MEAWPVFKSIMMYISTCQIPSDLIVNSQQQFLCALERPKPAHTIFACKRIDAPLVFCDAQSMQSARTPLFRRQETRILAAAAASGAATALGQVFSCARCWRSFADSSSPPGCFWRPGCSGRPGQPLGGQSGPRAPPRGAVAAACPAAARNPAPAAGLAAALEHPPGRTARARPVAGRLYVRPGAVLPVLRRPVRGLLGPKPVRAAAADIPGRGPGLRTGRTGPLFRAASHVFNPAKRPVVFVLLFTTSGFLLRPPTRLASRTSAGRLVPLLLLLLLPLVQPLVRNSNTRAAPGNGEHTLRPDWTLPTRAWPHANRPNSSRSLPTAAGCSPFPIPSVRSSPWSRSCCCTRTPSPCSCSAGIPSPFRPRCVNTRR